MVSKYPNTTSFALLLLFLPAVFMDLVVYHNLD